MRRIQSEIAWLELGNVQMNIRDATNKSVSDILKQYYTIPRFQRPYSWGKEEIDLFYDDIVTGSSQYFIGHMVTYRINDDTKGVIDGQQRLTTITLILCAIRNKFIQLGDESLTKGVQTYIQTENRDGVLQNVLISESSSPYIQKVFQDAPEDADHPVEATPATEEEEALKAAFRQINEKIDNDLNKYRRQDYKKNFLKKLRDGVLGAVLIYVEMDNEDDAYTIFQTLNSTGKDLDLSDLIKSQLLNLLRATGVTYDGYKDIWRQMIFALNKNTVSPDTFFQHFWVSRNGLITKSRIFKQFKQVVSNKTTAKEMLESIIDDSKTYIFLEDPAASDLLTDAPVRDALEALKIFKVTLAHPFLLSMLRSYKEGRVSLTNIRNCLERIEKFHFLYTAITSSRASGISNKYAAYAKRLFEAQNANEKNTVVRELDFSDKIPTYQECKEEFQQIVFYEGHSTSKKIVRYILTEIDRCLKPADGRSTDYSAMTIEHIISQKQTSLGSVIGMIGNLILVDRATQEKLNTKPLDAKIKILHECGFDKDKFFLASGLKGAEWINDRTEKLCGLMHQLSTS
jgi:uncharacterized protein with ParB-like and HNH nuclease domain